MSIFKHTITKVTLISSIVLLGVAIPVGAVSLEQQAKSAENHVNTQDRLSDARLKSCQNKEKRINDFIKDASTRQTKRLNGYEHVQQQVETFYANKKLSSTSYQGAVNTANQDQQAAQAAISKFAAITFVCANETNTAPGQAVRSTFTDAVNALSTYRKSVHSLILVVRGSKEGSK